MLDNVAMSVRAVDRHGPVANRRRRGRPRPSRLARLWRFLPATHETLGGGIVVERYWWMTAKLLFTSSVITTIVMTLIGLSRSGAFG